MKPETGNLKPEILAALPSHEREIVLMRLEHCKRIDKAEWKSMEALEIEHELRSDPERSGIVERGFSTGTILRYYEIWKRQGATGLLRKLRIVRRVKMARQRELTAYEQACGRAH